MKSDTKQTQRNRGKYRLVNFLLEYNKMKRKSVYSVDVSRLCAGERVCAREPAYIRCYYVLKTIVIMGIGKNRRQRTQLLLNNNIKVDL